MKTRIPNIVLTEWASRGWASSPNDAQLVIAFGSLRPVTNPSAGLLVHDPTWHS